MRLLAPLLVLAALGCNKSPSSSAPAAPQVAGLIAVPASPTHLVGPTA